MKTIYYLGLIVLFIGLAIFFGVCANYCHKQILADLVKSPLNLKLLYISFILLDISTIILIINCFISLLNYNDDITNKRRELMEKFEDNKSNKSN